MCQWGIILFLCWLLMHCTAMGLHQNRAGPVLSKIVPFASWIWLTGGKLVLSEKWSVCGATGNSLLDACPKQGTAGSCLLLLEWLLHGQGRLGLEDHASLGPPPSTLSRDLCEAEAVNSSLEPSIGTFLDFRLTKRYKQYPINLKRVISARSKPATAKMRPLVFW